VSDIALTYDPPDPIAFGPSRAGEEKMRSLRFMAIYRCFNNCLSGFGSRFFERLTLVQGVFVMIQQQLSHIRHPRFRSWRRPALPHVRPSAQPPAQPK
jgi:hypothetical protein